MRFASRRITIVTVRKPLEHSINEKLQWLGNSLGLFSIRDRDKSCFRIFIDLIKSSKSNKPLTSDQLAENLNLSRGTVIHHVNRLMQAGLVVHEGNRYMLRMDSLSELVDEVQKDVERSFDDMRKIAKEIDGRLTR